MGQKGISGVEIYSFETILQIFPDSSIRRSFTAEVPRSTPIKYILSSLPKQPYRIKWYGRFYTPINY